MRAEEPPSPFTPPLAPPVSHWGLLAQVPAKKLESLLAHAYLKSPAETSVNGYLIDTGAAGLFGPTLGKLLGNLKAAGYQPEQVDEIYLTHMRPDHVGGLVAEGKMAFPNAVVRADMREGGFWLSTENLDKAPADAKGFFQGAMASLNPYVAPGKLKPFDGETELVPGIRATPALLPGYRAALLPRRKCCSAWTVTLPASSSPSMTRKP